MKKLGGIIAGLVFLFSASFSYATLMKVSGDFSIGPDVFDLGTFSGSFSFSFDDASLLGSGYHFEDVTLDSLTLSPNYGGFDLTNVFGYIQYLDGSFDLASIGADIGVGDDQHGTLGGTNDFYIGFYQSFSLNDFVITREGFGSDVAEEDPIPFSGTVQIEQQVPEPSTLALLSLGLTGLGFTRRRMKA